MSITAPTKYTHLKSLWCFGKTGKTLLTKAEAAPLMKLGLVAPTGKRVGNSTEYGVTSPEVRALARRVRFTHVRHPEGFMTPTAYIVDEETP